MTGPFDLEAPGTATVAAAQAPPDLARLRRELGYDDETVPSNAAGGRQASPPEDPLDDMIAACDDCGAPMTARRCDFGYVRCAPCERSGRPAGTPKAYRRGGTVGR